MTNVIKKNGINFGIILAIYFVLRTALIYSIDLKLFVNGWFGFLDFVVTIIITIIAVYQAKKAMGGFIAFKEAFTTYFIATVIGLVTYSLFNILLFNVIDPAAKETVQEHVLEKTVEAMQQFGADSDSIRETAKGMRETDSFSIPQQLLGLGISIIIYSIIGLIIAAIMKKNKPEFE